MQHLDKLQGRFVDLEVLTESHKEALFPLINDPALWVYMLNPVTEANFPIWFEKALQNNNEGGQLSFAVRRKADQKVIGSTRFYKIAEEEKRLALGYTWFVQEARGTQMNPESKLLLLTYAFESMGMNRVEFNINPHNSFAHSSLKKFGATEEGILRMNRIMANGHPRDTAVYSMIKPEWPRVKEKLNQLLA